MLFIMVYYLIVHGNLSYDIRHPHCSTASIRNSEDRHSDGDAAAVMYLPYLYPFDNHSSSCYLLITVADDQNLQNV